MKLILLFIASFVIIAAMFFIPAGTIYFWQACIFMTVLFIPVIFVGAYLIVKDPKLLERRFRFKEKESQQKLIIKLANALFFLGILIPGLDFRFGWSNVPVWLVILSDVLVLSGYVLVFFVFKENTHTSRIIEVEEGQKVISTGPYSVIRHPMYAGVILMSVSLSTALGSY